MKITVEVAIVVLTDRAGRVLMQHRGHDAHVEANRWMPPGGQVEPGEDAESAAHRELIEETGLTAALEFAGTFDRVRANGSGVRFHVFTGGTDAGQDDVVLGEGQAMEFLTIEEIATKDLASNVQKFFSLADLRHHATVNPGGRAE